MKTFTIKILLLNLIHVFNLFSTANNVPNLCNINLVSIPILLQKNPDIIYQNCHDAIFYNLKPFPLSFWPNQQPYTGLFAPTFVLTIPDGRVYSRFGFVVIGERYMLRELIVPNYYFYHTLNLINEELSQNVYKAAGRVAVITRQDTDTYGHWIIDILGRIALLEIMGIEYDWIYIPYHKPYMKESLQLWGIDTNKIIEPYGQFSAIQADELIVPSLVSKRIPTKSETFSSYTPLTVYYPHWAVEYIRNKYLPLLNTYQNNKNFKKRIFISRKDSPYSRKIVNEDEVFELFKNVGFERYELSKLPFLEQLYLFNNAEIIVSPNGSGLSNIMFCCSTTRVIEIFQARADSSFYNLAQTVGLDYSYIVTGQFHEQGFFDTYVPLYTIQAFIDSYTW